jgi:UDP-N-acetylmuramoyl-tripeptide--D-alanyl-D-alanine ligase
VREGTYGSPPRDSMQRVRLIELLNGVDIVDAGESGALKGFHVHSLSTDSRSLKRDDLFIALPGDQYDGHAFIAQALRAGASGVVLQEDRLTDARSYGKKWPDRLFVVVPDTRRALGSMARNYVQRFEVRKVALTGSAGKTTTKALIHAVLSQRYRVTSSVRSFNNDIGVPKTLLNVDESTEILVQEMGTNHPGEIRYLAEIVQPDCALITNIGPAHIGYFGSEKAIAVEKKEVFNVLHADGAAFANRDDRFFDFLTRDVRARVLSFGLKDGDLKPERIDHLGLEYSEFVLFGRRLRARVLGVHGIVNAVAAALVGRYFGLSVDEIAEGLEQFQGESGRGDIYRYGEVTIVDESYNANPLSVSASLAYLGGVKTSGRKIFVFADMLELGPKADQYHRRVALDILRCGIDVLFTFGEKAGVTAERCMEAGQEHVRHFDDVEALRCGLLEEIRDGDLVLVKGSRAMRLERVIRDFL